MNKKLSIAMGIALATGMAGTASAEEDMGLEFSANVALTSDYVFRGVSQTNEEMAVQGGFDVSHSSGLYAGIWASVVDDDFYADADIEVDYYLGWGGEVGPVGVDVGYLHYEYPGTNFDPNNTDEFHVGVSGDLGPVSAGVTYYYSDDFFGLGDSDRWEFGAEMPAGPVTVAVGYGINEFDAGGDYDDWSIGGSTELGGFGFDLTYYDTDIDGSSLADDRIVFTVSKSM